MGKGKKDVNIHPRRRTKLNGPSPIPNDSFRPKIERAQFLFLGNMSVKEEGFRLAVEWGKRNKNNFPLLASQMKKYQEKSVRSAEMRRPAGGSRRRRNFGLFSYRERGW